VIAHRLATVRRANRILVLEKGKIIESGSHGELLTLNGRYARFYAQQFS
jgi:ATP-binding cassette, subfamily B, bacterial